MAPPAKRMKYAASFKLKVVAFANSSNNCAAAREFGVNEKLVRDWKKDTDTLKTMPKTKCAMRSGTCRWPELEKYLEEWVLTLRQNGYTVLRNAIRVEAVKWGKAHPEASIDFKGTANWCSRFMKRKNLVLRQKTKIAQKLPVDLADKTTNFHKFVIKIRKKYDFPLAQIGNMDETPVFFDMLSNRTVETKGTKTVLVKSTGHEKTKFSVVLSCMADGTKLKPMVIFKRKTMPKIKFPDGVFVHVHENGWMDQTGVKLWIENVWNQRSGALRKLRSLLVWDMFRAHLTTETKKYLKQSNTETAVIPGGLTSILQPLDVFLNKPFKDRIRHEWNQWMIGGEKTYTAGGNLRAPSLAILCEFVIRSWDAVAVKNVIKSFKKCGISNSLDGQQDDMLWENEDSDKEADGESSAEANATSSGSEADPYDDLPEQDFEGF